MKKLDIAAVALSLTVATVLSLRVYAAPAPREPSVLIQAPAGSWIYPLSQDRLFSDAGPPGTCVVSIRAGEVRVLSSDCPRMICIQTGAVSRPGAVDRLPAAPGLHPRHRRAGGPGPGGRGRLLKPDGRAARGPPGSVACPAGAVL